MMAPQQSVTNISLLGRGDVRDRIQPVSLPSVCDLASSASQCLVSLHSRPSRINSTYVKPIVADSLASGPFEDFLAKKDCHKARLLLNFWCDAQVRTPGMRSELLFVGKGYSPSSHGEHGST